MKHKIGVKRHPWTRLTNDMVNWMVERCPSLKDEEIELHNPLFVECIEALQPSEFRIVEINEDEYLTLETANDVIVMLPSDIKVLEESFIKINEQE